MWRVNVLALPVYTLPLVTLINYRFTGVALCHNGMANFAFQTPPTSLLQVPHHATRAAAPHLFVEHQLRPSQPHGFASMQQSRQFSWRMPRDSFLSPHCHSITMDYFSQWTQRKGYCITLDLNSLTDCFSIPSERDQHVNVGKNVHHHSSQQEKCHRIRRGIFLDCKFVHLVYVRLLPVR